MSLNIKNERTHALVRELAALTGMSQTSAVEDAVRRRLDELAATDASRAGRLPSRLSEAEIARRTAAIERIVAEFRADAAQHPGPSMWEIADGLYDDGGLPA